MVTNRKALIAHVIVQIWFQSPKHMQNYVQQTKHYCTKVTLLRGQIRYCTLLSRVSDRRDIHYFYENLVKMQKIQTGKVTHQNYQKDMEHKEGWMILVITNHSTSCTIQAHVMQECDSLSIFVNYFFSIPVHVQKCSK